MTPPQTRSRNTVVEPAIATGAIALRRVDAHRDARRHGELVRVGLPFGRGWLPANSLLGVFADEQRVPSQVRVLDRWSDGSARWAVMDFPADAAPDQTPHYCVRRCDGTASTRTTALRISSTAGGVSVDTGAMEVLVQPGGVFPISAVSGSSMPSLDWVQSSLRTRIDDQDLHFEVADVEVEESGPLRVRLLITGRARSTRVPDLEVTARVDLTCGSPAIRTAITLRNVAPAEHPRGIWTLGGSSSMRIRSVGWTLRTVETLDGCSYSLDPGAEAVDGSLPFRLHQESSGGEHWNSPVHRDADGKVPLAYRGYLLRTGSHESSGHRATPVACFRAGERAISVAVPKFWQRFPGAITADAETIGVDLLPDTGYPHELQGGEQTTREFVVTFGLDATSPLPLDWVHRPLQFSAEPAYVCATGAAPYLPASPELPDPRYEALIHAAIDGDASFFRKREAIDEFGWRNFGDLYADHETVRHTGPEPLVSHYNNQYDAIAGFGVHYLRTGDARWWELMDDLARHVCDIDIYRTARDKAAYNGGLFWHTYHYTDAATCTHRTYPREMGAGGGPSAEHNYTTGLMLHYFLTGNAVSRDAAIGLAEWVLRMDDGAQTVFRWLVGGATGLASASGHPDYHGPGRGAANSIVVCVNAYRLTGERKFLDKSEELIRRCIHPDDDIDALDLLDPERRWYYTVFLQALAYYLRFKEDVEEADAMTAYATEALLRYARWMADHERPYLDRPEQLEYPTETWAAQDMRKAQVFAAAASLSSGGDRERFSERRRFFYDYSVQTLGEKPTRVCTRPIVLMLLNGLEVGGLARTEAGVPSTATVTQGGPVRFETQKRRAFRRARLVTLGAALGGVAAAALALATYGF